MSLRTSLRAALLALLVVCAPASAGDRPTLVVGTYAYPQRDRAAAITPLADYLARELDRQVEVRILPSPTGLVEAMYRGEVDVAVPNLDAYLRAHAAGLAIMGLPVPDVPAAQAQRYRAVIVSQRELTIERMANEGGALKLVLVGADSASGGFVPLSFLSRQGLPHTAFAEVSFAGSHAAALAAVAHGKADIAALAADVFDANPSGLHEIWRSPVIPPGPLLCRISDRISCPQVAALLRVAHERDASVMAGLREGWPEFGDAMRLVEPEAAQLEAIRRDWKSMR